MAKFSVLKDPNDRSNFVVAEGDQAGAIGGRQLAAGAAAGAAPSLPPLAQQQFGTFSEQTPRGQRKFGPGSKEAFKEGVFNITGRANKKRFELNLAQFWRDVDRAGVTRTPELEADVGIALKSQGGFDAARDAARDHFFNQPDQQAQREADLDALQKSEARKAETTRLTNQNLKNQNEIFEVTQGVPMEQYTRDKQDFFTNMELADLTRDVMTLNTRFGVMRDPLKFTDADRSAVAEAYEQAVNRLSVAVAQANKAGALTEAEFERYRQFLPQFGTTAPLQDSVRRVTLNSTFDIFQDAAESLRKGNRGLEKGSEKVTFDLGPARGWQEIIGLTESRKDDVALDTPEKIEEARRGTAIAQTVEQGEFGIATGEQDFFTGLQDLIAPPSLVAPGGGRAKPVGGGAQKLREFFPPAREAIEGETAGERLRRERRGR